MPPCHHCLSAIEAVRTARKTPKPAKAKARHHCLSAIEAVRTIGHAAAIYRRALLVTTACRQLRPLGRFAVLKPSNFFPCVTTACRQLRPLGLQSARTCRFRARGHHCLSAIEAVRTCRNGSGFHPSCIVTTACRQLRPLGREQEKPS